MAHMVQEVDHAVRMISDGLCRNVLVTQRRTLPPQANSRAEHHQVLRAGQRRRWDDDGRHLVIGLSPALTRGPIVIDELLGIDPVVTGVVEREARDLIRHRHPSNPRPWPKLSGLVCVRDAVEAEVLSPAPIGCRHQYWTVSPAMPYRPARRFGLAHSGVSQFAKRNAKRVFTSARDDGPCAGSEVNQALVGRLVLQVVHRPTVIEGRVRP